MKFYIGGKRRAQALAKIRRWMISIGVTPNEPVFGYPAPAAVYALLFRKHGTGTYTVDKKLNLFHGVTQILHKDELQDFLTGTEVKVVATAPAGDEEHGYFPLEEDGKIHSYECETCGKTLKTEKGMLNHIAKVHEG
jgi:hypothetical protein